MAESPNRLEVLDLNGLKQTMNGKLQQLGGCAINLR
jgi:hypothetical protein